jgi:hypothetical protein
MTGSDPAELPGREFLDTVRDGEVWKRRKDAVRKPGVYSLKMLVGIHDVHRTLNWSAVRAALGSRSPAAIRVQLWVHYGSNKRCVGLFPAL